MESSPCGCTPAKIAPACCGTSLSAQPPGPVCDRFVDRWLDTPAGRIPHISTTLGWRDTAGRWLRRWGIRRAAYRVEPGLYAVGNAGAGSPVLVTANYKMTFDALRKELGGLDAWVLVLDTRGVNVWCAAGEGTFGTEELVRRVKTTELVKQVSHRKLVLPQLGAPGVSAHRVREGCGFSVAYGPVFAKDLRRFLENGMKATPRMRAVTFTTRERLVLTPMELVGLLKPSVGMVLGLFLLSGIGPGVFSLASAWQRGIGAAAVWGAGVLGGAVATPLLLPWLPGRAFSAKGALVGAVLAGLGLATSRATIGALHGIALMLALPVISSFVAMNFTGATPYTSPSGVEKEMRRSIPLQASAALLAGGLWVGAAFVR